MAHNVTPIPTYGRPEFAHSPGYQHGPSLSTVSAQIVVGSKKAPRVTQEDIEAKIQNVEYVKHSQMTIAIITMFNGFMVTGVSAPASASNFDADVGKRYAYDNAFKQLWQLEGYLLREKLSAGHA